MPGLGLFLFDGQKITLNDPFIPQWPQTLKLAAPYSAAGRSEMTVGFFTREGHVEGNQFAGFVAAGMMVGAKYRGPFQREKDFPSVGSQEFSEGRVRIHLRQTQGRGHGAQSE